MLECRTEAGTPDNGIDMRVGAVFPYDTIPREMRERTNRMQHSSFARFTYRREHNDVAQTASRRGVRSALGARFPSFGRTFKENTSVDLVRQERGLFQRNPGCVT